MAAYVSAYSNSMDVAGFGFNTQSAMFYQSQHAQFDVHNGICCTNCGSNPLRGIRWRCQSCPEHNICNTCKKNDASGHPFQIASTTTTNNQMAAAQGLPQTPEAGVHWTVCQGCNVYPIKGTLYSCMQCQGFDLCDACNRQRVALGSHLHRFDFFYVPRDCNPPPGTVGSIQQQVYTGCYSRDQGFQQAPNIYSHGPSGQGNADYIAAGSSDPQHETSYGDESGQHAYNGDHGYGFGERKRDKFMRFVRWLNEQSHDTD